MNDKPYLLINIDRHFMNPGIKKYFPGIEKELLSGITMQMKSSGYAFLNLGASIPPAFLFPLENISPSGLSQGFPIAETLDTTIFNSGKYLWRRNYGFVPSMKVPSPGINEPSPTWIDEIMDKCLEQLSAINKAYDDDLALGISYCFFRINRQGT